MNPEVLTHEQLNFIGAVREWLIDSAARIIICNEESVPAIDALETMLIDYDGIESTEDGEMVQPMIDAIVVDLDGREALAEEIDSRAVVLEAEEVVDEAINRIGR